MKANLDLVKTNWSTEVNDIASVEPEGQRSALPLHTVVAQFKLLGDNNLLGELDKETIDKFKTISDEKIKYYHSTRFGFIKEFFSKLRNLFTVGQFISSGQLGYNLADRFLNPAAETVEVNKTEAPKSVKKPEAEEVEDDASFSDQEEEQAPARPVASQQRKAAPVNTLFQGPVEDIDEKGVKETYYDAIEEEAPAFPTLKDEWGTTKENEVDEGVEVEKEEESDDDYESFEEEAEPAVQAPAPEAVAAPQQPTRMNPREQMEGSLTSVWAHSNPDKTTKILKAWNALFKGANITGWERIGRTNEYKMTLAKPVTATIPFKPLINLTFAIPKEVSVIFSEREEFSEWKQAMTFVTPLGATAFGQNGKLLEIIVDSAEPYPVDLCVQVPATMFSKEQISYLSQDTIEEVIQMLGKARWS